MVKHMHFFLSHVWITQTFHLLSGKITCPLKRNCLFLLRNNEDFCTISWCQPLYLQTIILMVPMVLKEGKLLDVHDLFGAQACGWSRNNYSWALFIQNGCTHAS